MSIRFEKVNYVYNPGTTFEYQGLKDISFDLADNSFVAIIGHTGSGKSTLLQHFDALLKPTAGSVEINGFKIDSQTNIKKLKELRKKVGIVFQFPESQLFAETVLKDVMFGPENFGYSSAEAEKNAKKWLKKVGISEDLFDKSPFDLSGGQMRRVAIAGVLAYEPEILCLDEPAAGLDPQGRLEMLSIFKQYQRRGHMVILITHEMDDVTQYADDVLVLEHGTLIKHDKPEGVFENQKWLLKHHLNEPQASQFANHLKNSGFHLNEKPLTLDKLSSAIVEALKKEQRHE